jgi:phosphatidylglycerophosphate synthase
LISGNPSRRPIRSRNTLLAFKIAKWLASKGVRPNQISIMSIVFSALAALCLTFHSICINPLYTAMLIGAALFILLRLLCNLFDGMIAIEFGFSSKYGEIYNDFPDRIADSFILIGVGYAALSIKGSLELALLTALLAILTAYVRLLGASLGIKQYFIGPMAKQQRMALIIAACFLSIIIGKSVNSAWVFLITLGIIAIGSLITIGRRLRRILMDLKSVS